MGRHFEENPAAEIIAVAFVHRRDKDGRELEGIFRELQYPLDDEDRADICRIAAGCSCGWRSAHWRPFGRVEWWPSIVELEENGSDDRRIDQLGREHAKSCSEGGSR